MGRVKRNPYPPRLKMEELLFEAMAKEIDREVETYGLTQEMGEEKAFELAEQIGRMSVKKLQKNYSFWVVKLKRKPRKKNPLGPVAITQTLGHAKMRKRKAGFFWVWKTYEVPFGKDWVLVDQGQRIWINSQTGVVGREY